MSRILLIDDDSVTIDTLRHFLQLEGHDVVGALTGHDGVRMAREFDTDVAAIDLDLPDITGIDVLRELQRHTPWIACFIVTGFGSWHATIEAMRAGACDWLNKPVSGEDMLKAVKRALVGRVNPEVRELYQSSVERHALRRLVEKVAIFIVSPDDRPTLRGFGRVVGVSPGGFRNWCRTAGLHSRSILRFSRALRAVHRQEQDPSARTADLLDIVDRRTLAKFVIASGGVADRLPPTVEEFVRRQRFIANPEVAAALYAALLANKTLMPTSSRSDVHIHAHGSDKRTPQTDSNRHLYGTTDPALLPSNAAANTYDKVRLRSVAADAVGNAHVAGYHKPPLE